MQAEINLIMPPKERKIESLEDDHLCTKFLADLKTAENVNVFCICGNSYGLKFFQELEKHSANLRSVKKLVLSDIFISRKEEIVPSLEILDRMFSNKNLIMLDFSYNALCPDGCATIVNMIKTNKSLKYLYLNHVALSQAGTVSICDAIKEGELDLISFQAIKNRIEIQAVRVAEVVAKMPSLEELVLYQNNIKEEQMDALIDALKNCPNLKSLDISDNYIKSDSMNHLIELLENCNDLKVLKIGDCNIEDKDTKKFIQFLKSAKNKKLELFTYNYNDVDNVDKMVDALVEYKDLKTFELKGLGLDEDEVDALKEKLPNVECTFESEDEEEEEAKPVDKQSKIDQLTDEFLHLTI